LTPSPRHPLAAMQGTKPWRGSPRARARVRRRAAAAAELNEDPGWKDTAVAEPATCQWRATCTHSPKQGRARLWSEAAGSVGRARLWSKAASHCWEEVCCPKDVKHNVDDWGRWGTERTSWWATNGDDAAESEGSSEAQAEDDCNTTATPSTATGLSSPRLPISEPPESPRLGELAAEIRTLFPWGVHGCPPVTAPIQEAQPPPKANDEALTDYPLWSDAGAAASCWRARLQQHGQKCLAQIMIAKPAGPTGPTQIGGTKSFDHLVSCPQEHGGDHEHSRESAAAPESGGVATTVAPLVSTNEMRPFELPAPPYEMGSCRMMEPLCGGPSTFGACQGWHSSENESRALRRRAFARALLEEFRGATPASVAEKLKAAQPQTYED